MPLSPGGFVAPPPLPSLTDRSKGSSSSCSLHASAHHGALTDRSKGSSSSCSRRLGERRDSRESSAPSEPTSI